MAPIRQVIGQIEDDLETRSLLEGILEDELATIRWLHATGEAMGLRSSAEDAD